ncbi:MAG: hypothetical protein EOO40_05240 [Deltaproteobacteria bacterium]|nr:MAG: hypothetical protein EOO40_05240 [Deltaproteobacteria bacterium]
MQILSKLLHQGSQLIRLACLALLCVCMAYGGLAILALAVRTLGGLEVVVALGASVAGALACAAAVAWAQYLAIPKDARRRPELSARGAAIGDQEATVVA